MVLAAKEIVLKRNPVTPSLALHAVAGKNGVDAPNLAMAAKEIVSEHALTKMVTDLVTENLKTVILENVHAILQTKSGLNGLTVLSPAVTESVSENVAVMTMIKKFRSIYAENAHAQNGEIGNVQHAVKLAEADSNFVNENVLVETQAITAVKAQTMSSDHATAENAQVSALLVLQ